MQNLETYIIALFNLQVFILNMPRRDIHFLLEYEIMTLEEIVVEESYHQRMLSATCRTLEVATVDYIDECEDLPF